MVGAALLSQRYRLEDRIAGGGMGTVFSATDERLHRRVAVKLLRDDLAQDPRFVERFRREARAVAALVHPNIASVFDYGEDEGRYYIVMELIPGRDLARVLREERRIAFERTRAISVQVCDALGHAHAAGIVHRDVKPANVIVDRDDRIKVTDFGIARAAGDTTLTAAGAVLGTAQYISPEQASDGAIGPPSDVYSTGIMLFEMLTASPPFSGDSPVALAMRHLSEDVPRPRTLDPSIPPDLDDVVARATAKQPDDRFGNGAEMAAALRGAPVHLPTARMAAHGAALVPPATPVAATQPLTAGRNTAAHPASSGWSPRLFRRAAAALIALALVAAALVIVTVLADEPQSRRRERSRGSAAPAAPVPRNPSPTATPDETQVAVPADLVGSNVHDAEAVLKEAGLQPAREDVESQEEKDIVVATNPPEGTAVSPGDVVTLSVSRGPQEPTPDDGEPKDEEKKPPGKGKAKGKGEHD